MNENDYLLISDDGPGFNTIEGEGRLIGKPSIFLRLFGCNLTCKGFASADSPWGCDSYISWSKKNKYTFDQMFKFYEDNHFVELLANHHIWKLTGGEPMLRQDILFKFVNAFNERYYINSKIDFETNATIMPRSKWISLGATFTTSPKLISNGDPEEKTYKPEVLKWHVDNHSCFKFVINSDKDLEEIFQKYIQDGYINVPKDLVWLMPACGSRAEHAERAPKVAEICKEYGFNFSPRLHLVLWDKALRV